MTRSLAEQNGFIVNGVLRPSGGPLMGSVFSDYRPAVGPRVKVGHEASTPVALVRAGSQQHSGYHVVRSHGMTEFARKLSSGGPYNAPLPEPEPAGPRFTAREIALFEAFARHLLAEESVGPFGRRRLR